MGDCLTILTPDAQYDDGGVLEKEVAGNDAEWLIHRTGDIGEVPAAALAAADAVVTWHIMPIDADFIGRLERCRVIVRAGVGIEHIDLVAAGRRGIPVCNTPDSAISEVADHAIGLMLALRRGITQFDRRLRADPQGGFALPPPALIKRNRGGVFGIVGAGAIGIATGLRARALGMEVVAYDPYAPAGIEVSVGFGRVDALDDLLAAADAISIHCPLTDETRGLFGVHAFRRMKHDAVLINAARGPVVDPAALAAAIAEHRIGGAAVDVFATEPLPADDPLAVLLRSDAADGRLILTPHAGWMSPQSLVDVRRFSAQTALRCLRHGHLRNLVNARHLQPSARA